MSRVVVAIYIDPDFYPPTINAILNLANEFSEVVVVTRNNSKTDFPFPTNVKLCKTGKFKPVAETEIQNLFYKIFSFIKFTFRLLQKTIGNKTSLLILFDPMPLLAFSLISRFLSGRLITWYHNHDMPDVSLTKKFTLGWFAAKREHSIMTRINYFSLPSQDRIQFYPEWQNHEHYFYIPNYPSEFVYGKIKYKKVHSNEIKLIFQGAIGHGHALEEFISLLPEKIKGFSLRLVLKGPVRPRYKEKLMQLAQKYGVEDQLLWIGVGPYSELPSITSSCNIGIAIHMGKDNVSRTLGTASNKIYEYAAVGLPVILSDDNQFTGYLMKYKWAFFTDGSVDGIRETLSMIIPVINEYADLAITDFGRELNFEKAYIPALRIVKAKCPKR